MTISFSPHFLRIFPRIFIVFLIIVLFSILLVIPNSIAKSSPKKEQVKGIKSVNVNLNLKQNVGVSEILEYLQLRPNDAYAWKLLKNFAKDNSSKVKVQIKETEEILKKRPDYAGAWLRLSVLYQQIGREDSAKIARDKAKILNWEF